ncbi:ABC transporter ATP-binding protein [Lipingzhangella sp. LS1_29]|uniref:ABC transporter ATP-binding protein n=1 Tax=Lipingzhangella rawalii TaxID=2055835 RepID=A0ABU2H4T9_9ACTN|nr:ABC transporter ATP-binding protein [Lipingzhangella rawalii]MDS1270316.1 ABC transporter ATP-binding protein [Lipingzhangella rawalii]
MSDTGRPRHPGTGSGLVLEQLSVGYRDSGRNWVPVLRQVTAEARRGELTVLLGPNGAGKSTLVRTVCGLAPPLSGHCYLDGVDLARMSDSERSRSLAVVLTERGVPGLVRARELVALGRHPHTGLTGRLNAHDHRRIAWALAAVGASDLAERRVGELSDGERQRVFTARALAQEPSALLLDEPTAFLDITGRVAVTSLLRQLAEGQHLAVVVCTHDLELALRVADMVWLVSRGQLRSGTPEELSLSGEIGAVFDGDDLVFDTDSGTFRPHGSPEQRRSAVVSGTEPAAAMTARALRRVGWHVPGPDEPAPPWPALDVHVGRHRFHSTHAGSPHEHATLGEFTRWARGLARERSTS